mmetsp:Transcript_26771/g.74830  ORF Transcript_26771/g.74830 Transcript_26771/m.74830 type:complete len:166 (+) Transcript_26771:156-653(+)|eukprot:CAMPEP_0119135856 /NCGR_PEP_ID=MMETSP1310-20130426/20182_1 /TAXON_ID=464262 /ORGANISM="Genus nov. species nov., Strain RCC2339" /LENGTH=165 /DNA_ID=CAMNT_0007126801 /DNA_START=189 /DNA_END=686 /DNA_ORIENTATION=-
MEKVPLKQRTTFEQRRRIATMSRQQYPDRVPIIVQRAQGCHLPNITREKFLAPVHLEFGKFKMEVLKYIPGRGYESVFLFAGGTSIPNPSTTMIEVWNAYRDNDDFLYIEYASGTWMGGISTVRCTVSSVADGVCGTNWHGSQCDCLGGEEGGVGHCDAEKHGDA